LPRGTKGGQAGSSIKHAAIGSPALKNDEQMLSAAASLKIQADERIEEQGKAAG
jgi:hypothetical protein